MGKKLQTSNVASTMCGSYGYAAPEVMLNALEVSEYSYAVDLYSYGVMVYMMVSGGDADPKNPRERKPPKQHLALRKKLKDFSANKEQFEWSKDPYGALDLMLQLTSEKTEVRTTASQVKSTTFFEKNLD